MEQTRTIRSLKKIKNKLKSEVSNAQVHLDAFRDSFAQDPLHALRWGQDTFQWAARVHVYGGILAMIEKQEASNSEQVLLSVIEDTVKQYIMSASRHVPSSTSKTSNLVDQYVNAAYADFYNGILNFGV